jgi:hypothetical protein
VKVMEQKPVTGPLSPGKKPKSLLEIRKMPSLMCHDGPLDKHWKMDGNLVT